MPSLNKNDSYQVDTKIVNLDGIAYEKLANLNKNKIDYLNESKLTGTDVIQEQQEN